MGKAEGASKLSAKDLYGELCPQTYPKFPMARGTSRELDVDVGELQAGTQSKPRESRVPYARGWPDLAAKTHLTSVLTPPTLGTVGILQNRMLLPLPRSSPGLLARSPDKGPHKRKTVLVRLMIILL